MRPEVAGAFRLAFKHEETAGLLARPWWRQRWLTERQRKHASKAQKLYEKARKLEARNLP